MIFSIVLLAFTTEASNNEQLASGFINGLRKSMTTTSPCYYEIGLTGTYFEDFKNLEFRFNETTTILNSFKALVNEFTSTVNLCKVQNVVDYIASLFSSTTAMENFKVNALAKTNTITTYAQLLQTAKNSQPVNYYDEGFYAGKIFSLLFNYQI